MSARLFAALTESLGQLLSPQVCRICRGTLTSDERVMCLACSLALPRTQLHRQPFNQIHQRLGHRYAVDRAAAWFYYDKDTPYARMLVDAKYGGLHGIDRELGVMCATELMAEGFFDGIDVLVPMPMHWRKRWLRGYNQAYEICRGISEVTGIGVAQAIRAVLSHGTQARHGKAQRHSSVDGTMDIADAEAVAGRHVLLIDDIITSGASCIEALRVLSSASPSAVSILSLGLTVRY